MRKLIILMEGGLAPAGQSLKDVLRTVYTEEDLSEGVAVRGGPEWQDPSRVIRERGVDCVACVHKDGKEWVLTKLKNVQLEGFIKYLKLHKKNGTTYELCMKFIDECLI